MTQLEQAVKAWEQAIADAPCSVIDRETQEQLHDAIEDAMTDTDNT